MNNTLKGMQVIYYIVGLNDMLQKKIKKVKVMYWHKNFFLLFDECSHYTTTFGSLASESHNSVAACTLTVVVAKLIIL